MAAREGREKRKFQFGAREGGYWKRSFQVGANVEALGTRRDLWEGLGARKLGKRSCPCLFHRVCIILE